MVEEGITILLAGLLASPVLAASCAVYPGGYCTQFINYPVYIPDGSSFTAIEGLLQTGGMELLLTLNSTTAADRPCVHAFVELSCFTVYPSCEDSIIEDTIKEVPCKSVCQDAGAKCSTLFSMFGKSSLLPDCEGKVLNLEVTYPSSSCLGLVSSPVTTIPLPPQVNVTCPSFLIKNPAYNDSNPTQLLPTIPGQQCLGSCCVPCPNVYQLYEPSSIQGLNIVYQLFTFLSLVGAVYCFVSYALFVKRRIHPGGMIMYYSFGCIVIHSFQIINIGSNGYRATCLDNITEAIYENSNLCVASAFFLSFGALYLTYWINIFMFNLHLQLVWRKDWFSEKQLLMHAGSLIYSFAPSIALIASKGVGSTGFTCLADVHHVLYILVPQGLIGWPGVIVTVFTVVHLCRMLLSAPGNSNQSTGVSKHAPPTGSAALGGGASMVSGGVYDPQNSGVAPSTKSGAPAKSVLNVTATLQSKAAAQLKKHREKMWDVIVKSWRSIAICIAVVVIYGSFWSFTLEMMLAFDNIS
ncbi:hypothetical protein BC830DRAFT_1076299, partial [Chytriomyces sp. MP71]